MPDCWLEVSTHPEGPATGQLVVFLGPRANAGLVPKLHVALHASHAALPILTSKFRPSVASLMLESKFHHMLPSQCLMSELGFQIECSGPLLNFFPCSTFHHCLLNFRTCLPPIQLTFTRRTSGHCLGTFIAANLAFSPPPPMLNVVSLTAHPTFSFFSLASLFDFKGLFYIPCMFRFLPFPGTAKYPQQILCFI
jgi:hypothetical protein